ncbi:hypothetical protein ARMGADRAFT_1132925 [Armillaria gallica]|uniref:Uncharacterized protein n=1 Tax=Armillaria gallica TaxID=47427 RepID=A0A2H3CMZ0_ARMGA|nr:hypothetical protein ARMGADRAFT_1132925 [Armillaria gallica]
MVARVHDLGWLDYGEVKEARRKAPIVPTPSTRCLVGPDNGYAPSCRTCSGVLIPVILPHKPLPQLSTITAVIVALQPRNAITKASDAAARSPKTYTCCCIMILGLFSCYCMLALIDIHRILAEMRDMKETASKEGSVDSGSKYPRARIYRKDSLWPQLQSVQCQTGIV